MAHPIIVLRHGKLVEEAPTREMLTAPNESYTRSLWAVRKLAKEESATSDLILKVEHVDAAYSNAIKILNNVCVSVPRGRTVAVVGESGSGKSTLARVVTGLLPPSKGDVKFNGTDLPPALAQRDKESLRRIQMIYQSPDTALNPRHRVYDIIGRPLIFYHNLRGAALDARVVELLKMIELDES